MKNLNKYIDHTLLKPEASSKDIELLCKEARTHQFFAVCVNPQWVKLATSLLKGTDVAVCTVVGFPLGATLSTVKAFETRMCVDAGATEIDMVIDIGAAKEGDWSKVRDDIASVVEAASGRLVKVILETCLLTPEEIRQACVAAMEAKAQFVKTSTGFSKGGATLEAVKIMKDTVTDQLSVKASGGIRSYESALEMIEAGADRLGTSSGVNILKMI